MLDGFQRWAQSDKPARAGGEEKEGVVPDRQQGGRMMDLTGGISFSDVKGYLDVLPDGKPKDFLKNAVDFGEKAVPFAKRFTSSLKNGPIRELAVDIYPTARPALDKVVAFMESLGLGGSGKRKPSKKMIAKVMASPAFKEYCERTGSGVELKDNMEEQMDPETLKKLMALKGKALPVARASPEVRARMMKLAEENPNFGKGVEPMAMKKAPSIYDGLQSGPLMSGNGIKEDIAAMNARTKKTIDDLNAKTKASLDALPQQVKELNKKTKETLSDIKPPTGKGRSTRKAAMRLLRSNGVSLKEAKEILSGGDLQSMLKKAQEWITAAKAKYDWIARNKKPIHQILESDDLNEDNPLGSTDIPKKIAGYMGMIGLGTEQRAEGKRHSKSRVAGLAQGNERAGEGRAERAGMLNAKERAGMPVDSDARVAATGGRAQGPSGRKPSAYALFVKDYAKKHPGLGKDLMKQAAVAWKSR
jgi:DNA-binding transcriptional MerR regulator